MTRWRCRTAALWSRRWRGARWRGVSSGLTAIPNIRATGFTPTGFKSVRRKTWPTCTFGWRTTPRSPKRCAGGMNRCTAADFTGGLCWGSGPTCRVWSTRCSVRRSTWCRARRPARGFGSPATTAPATPVRWGCGGRGAAGGTACGSTTTIPAGRAAAAPTRSTTGRWNSSVRTAGLRG